MVFVPAPTVGQLGALTEVIGTQEETGDFFFFKQYHWSTTQSRILPHRHINYHVFCHIGTLTATYAAT